MALIRLDRGHELDGGQILFGAGFPAGCELSVAGESVILRLNGWLYGNGRVEDLGLFRLEIHLHRGRGFRSWESAIKAEALRNNRGVEEGQGELVVVHGDALVRSACEREPHGMIAVAVVSTRRLKGREVWEAARLGARALGVV